MPINKEQLREKFKGLSTRYGGSLLTKNQLSNQAGVTLFFGLGGLGGRVVNAIKAMSNEKLNNPDRRFYRVLDTCLGDMERIAEATVADIVDPNQIGKQHGSIAADEMIALFDRAHPFNVADLDSSVDLWLDRKVFNGVTIDGRGAQQIRQIGRVMLLHNYDNVYSEVSNVIDAAKTKHDTLNVEDRPPMKIYIIAGISGGTGSGSIVDFSYMVRKALYRYGTFECVVEGILFTPDVQENDRGMDPPTLIGLKRNFYAAIKEVDYFYNNVAREKAYSCPKGEYSPAYKTDIFDECTIISSMAGGAQIARNSDEIARKLAEALTYEMTGVKTNAANGTQQSYNSFYSNVHGKINNWLHTASGIGMNLPKWLPMRYSSLGFSSFYVPRDELLAYCANRLMERLIAQWKSQNITEEQIIGVMKKSSLDSNRSFAKKIFELANCKESFEIEESEKPKDGWGPAPVKNCESYLEIVREIATSKMRNIEPILTIAEKKKKTIFVDPIISAVDKAFSDSTEGPVYAINLLSSGIGRKNTALYTNSGVLVRIQNMISNLSIDASNWKNDLGVMYQQLQEKARKLDGKLSADEGDLETFTNDSRQYAEDLLKASILEKVVDYLTSIYNDLNDKNNRVFEIYTTTFEFLLSILREDSEYVTNSQRKREGHTTIFSFDVANFEDNDPKSIRFKTFFEQVVDGKAIDKESQRFVNGIFGRLKQIFDPVGGVEPQQTTEDAVIQVVRDYFNDSFSEWTSDIIEKFCVIAYSDIDVTPQLLTQVWNDPALKNVALQKAAQDINISLARESAVMLTSVDPSRSIENYTEYTSFASLQNTPGLNAHFAGRNSLSESNLPEFVRFKRVFGIPLSLIDGLKECKEIYEQREMPGAHLDEKGDDWSITFPEPFSYNVSRFLGIFSDDGRDTTEEDRLHMLSIFNMAHEAKKLGILRLNESATNPAYNLYYKFLRHTDFSAEKETMYDKFKTIILGDMENGVESDFMAVLSKAGYALGEPVLIDWTFTRPEYNILTEKTDFGNDIVFGNFVTLIRSNYEWEEKLKEGVEIFSRVFKLYETAKRDLAVSQKYDIRLKEFARAICVEMVKEHTNLKTGRVAGYKLQYGARDVDTILIDNTGWNSFDKKFILYLFFVEKFMELDEGMYSAFKAYLKKFEDEGKAEAADVSWIYQQIKGVLDDPDYLGQYAETLRESTFKEAITDSRHFYDVPNPSNKNKNISAVVKNLKDFFTYLRNYLENNSNI